MSKIHPTPEKLKKSFEIIKAQKTPLERECTLLNQANNFEMPLDSYRKLFDVYIKGKIDAPFLDDYPKLDLFEWKKTLEGWIKWVSQQSKIALCWKLLGLLIEKGILIAAGVAIFNYLWTAPARKRQAHYQAWILINTSKNQPTYGGRKEALEILAEDKISLEKLDANNVNLRFINLKSANLQYANFEKTFLTGSNFSDAGLLRAKLQEANISGANFSKADLEEAHLEAVDGNLLIMEHNNKNEELISSNFQEAKLLKAKLRDGKFQGSKFEKANLQGADLRGADFSKADLKEALPKNRQKLIPSNLQEADFQMADLRYVNFQDANLQKAKFKGANLQEVIFLNADLKEVNFCGSKNLTSKQVQFAKNWRQAYYDSEFIQKVNSTSENQEKNEGSSLSKENINRETACRKLEKILPSK